MKTYLHAYINLSASPILNISLVNSRKGELESENNGIPLFFENFLHHDECSTY